MDVRAVLFDVLGTVVDWRGSLIAELSAWGAGWHPALREARRQRGLPYRHEPAAYVLNPGADLFRCLRRSKRGWPSPCRACGPHRTVRVIERLTGQKRYVKRAAPPCSVWLADSRPSY